ncbi:tetrapyrrole biosynthesis, uroporphyrinogen III synthase [Pilaira anomala]|nr:tetrapyrrole biosynthesis, uroporphyrinogen III synthase [Pilaira anomala]
MTKKIILFKKQDTIDQYHDLFLKHGYVPQFIPVLDHQSKNIETIKLILLEGPHQNNLNGLILTSHRSVQAMSEAYDLILKQGLSMTENVMNEWNQLPVYMVGPHTAKVLSQFTLFNRHSSKEDHWMIAPRASELIKPLIEQQRQKQGGKLLFLAGDKRRDLIPTELNAAQLDFLELQSYVTCAHPDLSSNANNNLLADWFVYFSPSGLKFLLDSIDSHTKQSLFNACQSGQSKIASIGPTTSDYILDQFNFPAHVMAQAPDAQHLLDAILQFDQKNFLL